MISTHPLFLFIYLFYYTYSRRTSRLVRGLPPSAESLFLWELDSVGRVSSHTLLAGGELAAHESLEYLEGAGEKIETR